MSEPKTMLDSAAWGACLLQKYRRHPKWLLFLYALMLLPFALIYWGAQHCEAAMDAFCESRHP